ncbi:hypothetical protein [Methanoculleus sp.]|uniref:hypothetical protein n=1 Tax=Methanoculleus sp. TaxID=90427 RepID=UPI001BD4484C|nr:hypothetical protein [Methanoculleus sp.]
MRIVRAPLILAALALVRRGFSIDRVYWYLPDVNTGFGGLIFLLATLRTGVW